MKINNKGCALCDSTWGNYYRTVEGTEIFFCCVVCADIFDDLIKEIKTHHQIDAIDRLEIRGEVRIRTFNAFSGESEIQGRITLNKGKIKEITFI